MRQQRDRATRNRGEVWCLLLTALLCCIVVDVSAKLIDVNEITPRSNYVFTRYDGRCSWFPRFEQSVTHCDVNVTWFPFDVQRCQLVFKSWMLNKYQLNITTSARDPLQHYIPSEVWTLTCTCSWATRYFFTRPTGCSNKMTGLFVSIFTTEWFLHQILRHTFSRHMCTFLASLLSNILQILAKARQARGVGIPQGGLKPVAPKPHPCLWRSLGLASVN